jgi:hypothetical protein
LALTVTLAMEERAENRLRRNDTSIQARHVRAGTYRRVADFTE